MNGPLWKGARHLLLQPRALQADLSCSGRHKWMVTVSCLGEKTSPIPALAPSGEQSADFHLSWPSPARSRASCLIPSAPLPARGFISICTDRCGGHSTRCFPSARRWGDVVTCCLPPVLHFWRQLQGRREHLRRIQTTCRPPEQGYLGSCEDENCIVPAKVLRPAYPTLGGTPKTPEQSPDQGARLVRQVHATVVVWFLREKRNPIAVVFVQEVRAGDERSPCRRLDGHSAGETFCSICTLGC